MSGEKSVKALRCPRGAHLLSLSELVGVLVGRQAAVQFPGGGRRVGVRSLVEVIFDAPGEAVLFHNLFHGATFFPRPHEQDRGRAGRVSPVAEGKND